jgi:UDP-GlcNAc:undecaprenyl-phosphate/decaprenyl-phosphate GlcNAc-1-phosphate transferase
VIASVAESALVSFVGCMILTPAVRAACTHYRILDFPGPLKIHTRPVPRLGGIAIALSIAAGILVSAPGNLRPYAFVLAALGVVWIAGVADDLRTISPYARLAAQIVSGVLIWLGGWRFLPGGFLPRTGAFSLVLICAVIALFTNALNFLDGSDGLAPGVAAIIGAAWLVISHALAHDQLTPAVAVCLAGSCTAFLFYNFAPATIHLGDSGSTVLGFCIGLLALSPPQAANEASSLAAATFLISILPIVDFAFAVFRRLRSGGSPLQGDRFHIYDRMLARGYSARAVALCFYATTTAMSLAAWLSLQLGTIQRLMIWILGVAGVLIFAIWLGALGGDDRKIRRAQPAKLAAPKETELPF